MKHKTKKQPSWANYYLPYSGQLAQKILGNANATNTMASIAASQVIRRFIEQPSIAARVLIIGPASSGKTELINEVVKLLQQPSVFANCSTLAPPSYKGSDISNALRALRIDAGLGADDRLKNGSVIVLDEVDKIRRRNDHELSKQIEYSLLPILSSEKVLLEPVNYDDEPIHFSSYSSLVLMAGVFPEVPSIEWSDFNGARKALLKYGYCEEFVSRISHIVQLRQPNQQILKTVIEREAENLSALYQTHGERPKLSIKEIGLLSRNPILRKLGVRSLRMDIHCMLQRKADEVAIMG